MTDQELTWLAEAAAKSHCIAEIGSWRGRSARVMADHTPGVIFCIDPWDDTSIGYPGWWTAQESPEKYKQKDWVWQEFQSHVGNYIGTKILPLRMFSTQGAALCRHHMLTFDMIFIDATHNYEHVREDILLWRPLLKPGGIFAGHDFNEPTCPEVAPAVLSLIPQVNVTGTIWCAA